MNIMQGQASEPDVNLEHALAVADAMQMQDLDLGQDQCQGQYENADFHSQQQQQSSILLMTTTSSSGNGAMKADSQTQNSRDEEESLVDNDHDYVPESILPATPSPPPSPTKNPLQDSEDDDDDEYEDDDDDDDDDTGNQSHSVTVGPTNTSTSATTPSGSHAAAEMPTEKYLKRIGYNRRLHICPYCKRPCKINNRFRHLRKSCQVTPEQLRFEESNKGSVEHWPKATLADYQNFYKDETISIEMESPSSKVATTATVEVEKRRSTVKLSQRKGQASVKTVNEFKHAAVKVLVPKRGRGRPKGSFKKYTCSYCGRKMHGTTFKLHEKKCYDNGSFTVDYDDSDEYYDVEEDNMKLVTSGKIASSSSASNSRNSVAASAVDG